MRLRSPTLSLWLLFVAGVATVLLLLLSPIGFGQTEFAHVAENACHAPLFAFVAIGLLLWLRALNHPALGVGQYLAALSLAVVFGACGEIAQSFAHRDAEWIDVGNDFLGAVVGLSSYALYDRRQPLSPVLQLAACALIAVGAVAVFFPIADSGFMYWQRWRQLPQLVSWNSTRGHHFVKPESAAVRVANLPRWSSVGDEMSLQVSPLHDGRWVGVSIVEPWPDWSGYSRLAVEVVNPNDAPLRLSLRIDDRAHNYTYDDRFTRTFDVAALTRTTLKVPLVDVQTAPQLRQIDLTQIALIILFQDADDNALPLYIRDVRLVL